MTKTDSTAGSNKQTTGASATSEANPSSEDGAVSGQQRHERVSLRFLMTPKWIGFHLLVAVGIVAMVNFGFWQLRRLDEVRQRNATIAERYDAPPTPIEELLPTEDAAAIGNAKLDDLQWRAITISGEYVDGQIRVVNRSQDGAAGWQSITPLALDDGRVVLINRGFVPLRIEDVASPEGPVELSGHLRLSQERTFGGLTDSETGALTDAQRIDIARLAPQFDAPLVPMYVELGRSQPAFQTDGLPSPVRPPSLDEGNHLSYAVQWFIFSIAVAVGWVFAVRHSIRQRQSATES